MKKEKHSGDEKVKCSLCNSSRYKQKYYIEKNGASFNVVRCVDCGMIYLNPRPSSKKIDDMYDEDYFHGKGFDKGVDYLEGLKYRKVWEPWHNSRLMTIERYVKNLLVEKKGEKRGSILDVGCGLGEFLIVARDAGWDAKGVELSKYSADIAKKKFKLDVFNGRLDDVNTTGKFKEKFDVITMIEVIEHLPNPLENLKKCHELLKHQGIIVIQTGDVESLYSKIKGKNWPYYLAGHLNYFSRRTLKRMLEKAGFEVIKIYSGDEISFRARLQCLSLLKRQKLINKTEHLKQIIMHIVRKMGLGGMTVYAKRK